MNLPPTPNSYTTSRDSNDTNRFLNRWSQDHAVKDVYSRVVRFA